MQITPPKESDEYVAAIREALELLIAQPTPAEAPPCQNCVKHVPVSCSPKCPEAQASLSSDPINFPLEEKVVSLSFELASTRLIETCWSCEGHFGHDGKLWKLPQVTFYAHSPVYPQLMLRHIQGLANSKRMAYEWKIVLSDFGQSWNFSYNIEPNLNGVTEPRLGALQQDLQLIAENLCESLKGLARKMLEEID